MAQRMRDWRAWRDSPEYRPKVRWLVDENGRECSYDGPGNCKHQYKTWDAFGPGDGPHAHETRCRPCMVERSTNYLAHEPEEVRKRRNARQTTYQKTAAGKATARRTKLKANFGITKEQYDSMFEQQGGVCYFCGFGETCPAPDGTPKALAVEHAHDCDQGHDPKKGCIFCIRGLACYNCNLYIERVERSPQLRVRFADLLARRPLLARS